MAIRLGTQNWINPAPFAAAAELTVEAGRAEGQMYANIGQGINRAVSGYEQKKERDRTRQDALTQQGVMNARADRAEAEMLKRGKLAASESILAAKRMNYEMAAKMHESFGTPETEAAVLKAQQDFQEANNWYQVSVGNNAQIETPSSSVPDYVGGSGMVVDGKTTSQMTDAELDDFLAKSERGEVDITYRGGATGDMGQGVGNVPPVARPAAGPSAEAAMEMAAETTDEAVLGKAQADYTKALANSRRYPGHAKAQNELADAERRLTTLNLEYTKKQQEAEATREATAKAQEAETKRARDKERVDAINASNRARGLPEIADLSQVAPVETTARVNANREDAQTFTGQRDIQKQTFATQQDLLDHEQAKDRIAYSNRLKQEGRVALARVASEHKDATAAAKATQDAIDNQKDLTKLLLDEYQTLKQMERDGTVSKDDEDLKSAYAKYTEAKLRLVGMQEGRAAAPAPTAAPSAAPAPTAAAKPWSNDPDFLKLTPEQKAAFEARMSGR